MNKPVHSGPSIVEFNTLVMYKLWYDYDYVKPKCEEKVKLCYIDKKVLFSRQQPMIFIKKLWKMLKQYLILPTINSKDDYLKGKKVIELMKNELGGNIMKELFRLRAKTYGYLTDDEK